MRDHVYIHLNGRPLEVRGADVFSMFSDYLRRKQGLTGTKVVCAEGDCGACSVLVGRPAGEGGLEYKAACSCILATGQLDGSHVVTIEGLKDRGGLNAIQESFVACHGAQCGFCTPGFVVAVQGVVEAGRPCSRECLKEELSGNLCRCTGYEAILNAASQVDTGKAPRVGGLYPAGEIAGALQARTGESMEARSEERAFFKPVTQEEAVALRANYPQAAVVAGGTDIGVGVNKGKYELSAVISTSGISAWQGITRTGAGLKVGALATLGELETACGAFCPAIAEYLRWFASPLIKNVGTVVGNVVTGSPIGDMMPPLLALDSEVELASVSGVRRVKLSEFYLGYRKSALRPNELMVAVHIPTPAPTALVRAYKVSKRKDLDISAVSAAYYLDLTDDLITTARVAYGGVAAMPVRLKGVEAYLVGKPLTEETLVEAGRLARFEVTPISDIRGSAEYRKTLVGNLFLKLVGAGLRPARAEA